MKKKQNNKKTAKILGGVALVAFVCAMIFTFAGFSNTITEIADNEIALHADAVLTAAEVAEKADISLAVTYFDQKADECVNLYDASLRKAVMARQFEWTKCGYASKDIEQGLVANELDTEHLPVMASGRLTPNRGLSDAKRWFAAMDGKSKAYAGVVKLAYDGELDEYYFAEKNFYPLDAGGFEAGDFVNDDGHNHLFTMNLAVPVVVKADGTEAMEIVADDDTFVFLNDQLVVDMGGVHDATRARLTIAQDGVVTVDVEGTGQDVNMVLAKGNEAMIRIFHADRDSAESELEIHLQHMDINAVDAKIADSGVGGDGELAYNDADAMHVKPLGRSVTSVPDNTHGNMVIAMVEGVMIVALAVLVVIATRFMIKMQLRR